MRIPLGWLRELVPTDLVADDLAALLVPRGVLVEAVLHPWDGLEGVVVARVIEVRDHPNSDTLCVARIQHGAGEIELVVGVRNMRAGDLVPWAPPRARVPVLPEPLGVRTIRGVESNGMLCSPRELAISQDHGGILIMPPDGFAPGDDVKSALGMDDAVFDIEIEPNRPDLLNVLGVAREVSALTGVALTPPDLSVAEAAERAEDAVAIRVDDAERWPRYAGRVIRGVEHGPSPLRAQVRLTACGMRPIDAVVDATNYTMLELGQPLHGFDLTMLAGPGIVVRLATDGEELTTLDGIARTLTAEDLLICDAERPVALAGVMGGETSEVSADTRDVLVESAYFTREGVLLTARRLDLHTEASHRFERGTDREGTDRAASRCAHLIARWAGGEVLAGIAAAGSVAARHTVAVRPSRAAMLLGYPVTTSDVVDVFDVLGMASAAADDRVEVEIPGYRVDIEREVDLIEEVIRVQGYEHVPSDVPRSPQPGGLPDDYAFAGRVRDELVRAGLREVRPVPFSSASDLETFGDTDGIEVANPISAEEGFLRTRLTPGLLRAVAQNQARGARGIRLFEVGTTFRRNDPDPAPDPFLEVRKAGFVLNGPAGEGWAGDRRDLDVLDAKGILEALLEGVGVRTWSLGDPPDGPFHPGRSAAIVVDRRPVGVLGEIHPRAASSLGIEGRVAVCVVGLGSLRGAADRAIDASPLPRFPPVRRDLAFIVADDTPAGTVHRVLREAGGPLLDDSALFDVYVGDRIPEGTKSLAFSVDVRAPDRTLTDEEAQAVVDRIVERLGAEVGARLRTG